MKRNFPPRYGQELGFVGAIILCIIAWWLVLRWIFG